MEAQFVLGQYYKTGCGVEVDMSKSVDWLVSAAISKHRGAQILLGNMYRSGDGVPADSTEADRWYDMAQVDTH